MFSKYGFNLLWSKEDEGFIATCPDFPSLSAFGETPEEALTEAKVALELFIESLQASGDPLPEASEIIEYSGQTRLRMPKSLHLSLAQNAAKEGVSLNTWLVTLLSERNSASSLVDKVCLKIETLNEAIKAHSIETKELMVLTNTAYDTIINLSAPTSPYPFSREGPDGTTIGSVQRCDKLVSADGYDTGISISTAQVYH
jgi:predicted RNase H-like HicB family nuclease